MLRMRYSHFHSRSSPSFVLKVNDILLVFAVLAVTPGLVSLRPVGSSLCPLFLAPALLQLSQALQTLVRSAGLWVPFVLLPRCSSWNYSALTSSQMKYPLPKGPATPQENMDGSRKLNVMPFLFFFFLQHFWTSLLHHWEHILFLLDPSLGWTLVTHWWTFSALGEKISDLIVRHRPWYRYI